MDGRPVLPAGREAVGRELDPHEEWHQRHPQPARVDLHRAGARPMRGRRPSGESDRSDEGAYVYECMCVMHTTPSQSIPSSIVLLLHAMQVLSETQRASYQSYWDRCGTGISLQAIEANLVDAVWADRPAQPQAPMMVHSLEYAGVTWQNKVTNVRAQLTEWKRSHLLVAALDEVGVAHLQSCVCLLFCPHLSTELPHHCAWSLPTTPC